MKKIYHNNIYCPACSENSIFKNLPVCKQEKRAVKNSPQQYKTTKDLSEKTTGIIDCLDIHLYNELLNYLE
jgi:hypothetical protein